MRRQLVPAALKPPASSPAAIYASASASLPIPGFRTSAAFLTSLGANLRITDDDIYNPSPLNTPSLRPYDLGALPLSYSYLTSMSASTEDLAKVEDHELTTSPESESVPNDPLAGIPELTCFTAETEEDKVAGLKLIADSVAQQRQTASRILIFNPANLAVLSVVLAIAAQLTNVGHAGIWRVFTTWIGLVMAYLVTIRMFTRGYLDLAEDINWNWLDEDRILVTRFGEEIIGALVLAWTPGDKKGSRRAKVGRGLIRGWAVRLKYRGKGIGTGLLEEAVEVVNEKGGDGIDFAEEHANATRILRPFYNGAFDKRDARAQAALDTVVKEKANFVKRGSR